MSLNLIQDAHADCIPPKVGYSAGCAGTDASKTPRSSEDRDVAGGASAAAGGTTADSAPPGKQQPPQGQAQGGGEAGGEADTSDDQLLEQARALSLQMQVPALCRLAFLCFARADVTNLVHSNLPSCAMRKKNSR